MALRGSIVSLLFLIIICSASKYSHRAKISKKDDSPTVTIDDGAIKGRVDQTIGENKTYYAFQGIPFAQPPLKELRFEAPQPNSKWNGTLDATADKPACLQAGPGNNNTKEESEDCLYINVYTTTLSQKKLKPVMVWIYGGSFVTGNSSYTMYGPDFLIEKDIVFVSFNYRLNVFGFLSTGDANAPGNNGLKDQVLALKWVQKNIAHFGGDPNSVTVFGESAGAASVSYLQLSDLSKGLFHRTILESGSALCTWSTAPQAKEDALNIAQELNINVTTTASLVAALKKVDSYQIIKVATEYLAKSMLKDILNGAPFTPVIEHEHEGAFLTGKAHDLVSKGQFHQVPSLMGFNSNEAVAFPSVLNLLFLLGFDLNNTKLVPNNMNINNDEIARSLGSEIKRHYFGWLLPIAIPASYENFIRFLTASYYVRPIRELVKQQSKYSKVYLYQFSYEGNLSHVTNRTYPGVGHAEDVYYIFRNQRHVETPVSPKDQLTRDRLIKLWTNFAKTSNPTPDPTDCILQNVTWVPAGSTNNTDQFYLDIGEDLKVGLNPHDEDVTFWNDLYQKNGHPPYSTY